MCVCLHECCRPGYVIFFDLGRALNERVGGVSITWRNTKERDDG